MKVTSNAPVSERSPARHDRARSTAAADELRRHGHRVELVVVPADLVPDDGVEPAATGRPATHHVAGWCPTTVSKPQLPLPSLVLGLPPVGVEGVRAQTALEDSSRARPEQQVKAPFESSVTDGPITNVSTSVNGPGRPTSSRQGRACPPVGSMGDVEEEEPPVAGLGTPGPVLRTEDGAVVVERVRPAPPPPWSPPNVSLPVIVP